MDEQPRDGMEKEPYEALWTRDTFVGVDVPHHRAVAITNDELKELSSDPRWRNVDRQRDTTLRRQLGPTSGFFGTLGDLAIFVQG